MGASNLNFMTLNLNRVLKKWSGSSLYEPLGMFMDPVVKTFFGLFEMKILLIHNFYGSSSPSGENSAYLSEKRLLKNRGHDVFELVRRSDGIREAGVSGLIKGALSTPWNPFSYRLVRETIRRVRPDIAHVHNTFPLLSPAVFHAAAGLGTATVLTLHNYRLFCAGAVLLKRDRPCTECMDKHSIFPSLKHGCYRNSKIATLPVSMMIALNNKLRTWRKHVDAFITLSEFQRWKMIDAGLPEKGTHIKPNFYPDPAPVCVPWDQREARALFVGRLGPEKGVHTLIDAWKKWGDSAPLLEIVGDGPDRTELEKMTNEAGLAKTVRFTGQLPFSEVQHRLSRSRLLILPSLCFEGFPMSIRESFALGVPAAVSRIGALPGIVTDGKNGVLFSPGDSDDACQKLKSLWENPERMAAMAENARKEFQDKYTPEINYRLLMNIYQSAILRKMRKA